MAKKDQPGGTTMAGNGRKVRVVVLPTNVALVSPPVERLGPLQEYEGFLIEDSNPAQEQPGGKASQCPELSTCSEFPAGLVPRFEAELTAAGYRVAVDDRRRFGQEFRVNKALCEDSYGESRALLRAAAAQPLGQVEFDTWHGLAWRVDYLCRLYPEARVLIATHAEFTAGHLFEELDRTLGASAGLLARQGAGVDPRCLVTTLPWLARLSPGRWQVLLLTVFDGKAVSEAAYRAVLRLRARRVYALVASGVPLGRRTRLRLEAMAGPRIDPADSP